MTTRIQILVDNFPDVEHKEWETEHGLSLLIEHDGLKVLCDMGASSLFWSNAQKMNLDLTDLSYAFISHGHADHSGGLRTFLERNGQTKVYLSSHIFQQRYFSSRRGGKKRDISTDTLLKSEYGNRLIEVADSFWMAPHIAIVKNVQSTHDCPLGNNFLTCQEKGLERLDTFEHELSLALVSDKGLIVISSCSHNGALNIMDSCCRFTGVSHVYAFIGGLHLVDSNQVQKEVISFLEDKDRNYPDTLFYTGHCTGEQARVFLSPHKNVSFFHTGSVLSF